MSHTFDRNMTAESARDLVAELMQVVDVRTKADTYEAVDVAIICESTYPYLRGGLSAVVHQICEAHPELRIGIVHITWDSDSPTESLYDVPDQVAWIMPVYQSMREHPELTRMTPRDSGLGRRARRAAVARVFDAIDAHLAGDDALLWRLYDEGVNPQTRTFRLWPLIGTSWFMREAVRRFAGSGMSVTQLFWKIREFASLAFAATDAVFPAANVYHAHTTGAASLLAAAAARQNGGRFLLTEHNLYTRDTINHGLGRSMATPVRESDLRRKLEYAHVMTGAVMEPTTDMRAWMWWWIRTGHVAYRAAEHITYLYPDAIEEARELGGIPAKSSVVPNGVTPSHFDAARSQLAARSSGTRATWRFAYAARVVPIKGLLDLIDALVIVDQAGFRDWHLDVLGPDGESPAYVEACHARVDAAGLRSRIEFHGSVDLRARFGEYDALLLPSHNEGQPIVVLEAMTIGLPTIGTRVGGMQELVADRISGDDGSVLEPCGLLVEAHDVDGMAREILRLVTTPGLAEDLGRAGQDRVDRRCHIDAAMGMYRDHYRGDQRATGRTSVPRVLATPMPYALGAPERYTAGAETETISTLG